MVPRQPDQAGCHTILGPFKDLQIRAEHHAKHPVRVDLPDGAQHADHAMVQKKGPPKQWVAASQSDPSKLTWKKNVVRVWLKDMLILDPTSSIAHRIVRYNQRQKRTTKNNHRWLI